MKTALFKSLAAISQSLLKCFHRNTNISSFMFPLDKLEFIALVACCSFCAASLFHNRFILRQMNVVTVVSNFAIKTYIFSSNNCSWADESFAEKSSEKNSE